MKWLVLVSWFLCSSVLLAPTGKGVFGVCVSYQATGKITTYIACLTTDGRYSQRRTLLEDEFVKYASGYWPSIYNPTRENLFVKEKLSCGVILDSITRKQYPYCSPLDSLWKIRFRDFPFKSMQDIGWSNKDFRPSTGQEKYLYKEFGIYNIDRDFFIDTNFWKLLRSVKDPEWINYYKNLP
jgi:hypothetical protein